MKSPLEVFNLMFNKDPFSKWLGIHLIAISAGKCSLQMTVKNDMLNGFGIAHGGISYSLADSTLAFASNAYGKQCVSIDTSINHLKAIKINDVLTSICEEKNSTNKTALYIITISNQMGETVAIFKGMVYKTGKEW